MGFSDIQSLYSSIGEGETTISNVVKKLPEEYLLEFQKKRFITRLIKKKSKSYRGLRVLGVDNKMIELGTCCHPVPGDKIQGILVKGKGVVIHRSDCQNIQNVIDDPDKLVPVLWDIDSSENFTVGIKLVGQDRIGFLRDIATAISNLNSNIVKINMQVKDSIATNTILIEVSNLRQLTEIMMNIRKVKGVINVERFDNYVVENNL